MRWLHPFPVWQVEDRVSAPFLVLQLAVANGDDAATVEAIAHFDFDVTA